MEPIRSINGRYDPKGLIVVPPTVSGSAENITIDWKGGDGPYLIQDIIPGGLETITRSIWGMSLEQALNISQQCWRPHIEPTGRPNPRIILSGATDVLNARGAEIYFLLNHGSTIGINDAIASREAALAASGSTVYGNSPAWQDVVNHRHDISVVNTGHQELNYNSHRLLMSIYEEVTAHRNSPVIDTLVMQILNNPDTVIQTYTADKEMSLILMYIYDQVNQQRIAQNLPGIEAIKVDANSVEITEKFNQKTILYPDPLDVIELNPGNDYEQTLRVEGRFSRIGQEIGDIDRMPGYALHWDGDFKVFEQRIVSALNLMANRWGTSTVYIKPSVGTDGADGFPLHLLNLSMTDCTNLVHRLFQSGSDWVMEPNVNYDMMDLRYLGINQTRRVAPSMHIREGKPYPERLLQLFVRKNVAGITRETSEWGGHIYIPDTYTRQHGGSFGIPNELMYGGLGTLAKVASAYAQQGLSRGGFDIAQGSIQTKWGPKRVMACQDPNIRTTGGDTIRELAGLVREHYGQELPIGTLVIKPNLGYEDMNNALGIAALRLGLNSEQIKLVTSVVPGWGMFGVIGNTPEEVMVNILQLENQLKLSNSIR